MNPIPVGTDVYHTGVKANSVVAEIDPDKRRDTHKVEFVWDTIMDCNVRNPKDSWWVIYWCNIYP